ncbi:MAG: peptidylprolyl isomerase [Verrucomicrobia bacterium]|nr:peptidylprolyl isomerase [Verrucomicrobiota bacterium]
MQLRFLFPALLLSLAPLQLQAEDLVLLQLETKGARLQPVVLELFEKDAPAHTANFKKLASSGFYEGLAVHRILAGALIQMGDPLSKRKSADDLGTGGPGYTLPAEIRRKHLGGSLAMGRLPDKLNPQRRSNGSQFYITLRPLPELDGTDTVFGQVLQGGEVLQELGRVETDTNDVPVTRIKVVRSKVVPRERLESELRSWNKPARFWWPF